jgi:two-component system chemotaxis sensor kinase CheA
MSKILLAEDDEYVSRVYERAFRLSGHNIEIATDGEQAWKILSDGAALPDVAIIDIALPKITGVELLAKIKTEPRLTTLPVVILTNSFNEEIEKQLLASGADLYLLKIDHEPKDVVLQVENLIRKSQ